MKKIVCAYLQGGLGNQCFIYATARALSIRAHAELRLNLDYFASDRVYRRHFELDHFCIDGVHEPLHSSTWRVLQKSKYHLLKRMGVRRLGNHCCDYWPFVQKPFPLSWDGTLTLDGYWQSEFYFWDQADVILHDFRLKDDSFLRNDPIVERMRKARLPVFLHMRSYKEMPGGNGASVLRVAFYLESLKYLESQLGKGMTVFVFSDDLAWAMERLRSHRLTAHEIIPVERRRSLGDLAGIRDFHLMQLCHHGIVANSSFSRFAAWLGEQRNLKAGRSPIYCHDCREKTGSCPSRWHFVEGC